jgi:hypothetical protein
LKKCQFLYAFRVTSAAAYVIILLFAMFITSSSSTLCAETINIGITDSRGELPSKAYCDIVLINENGRRIKKIGISISQPKDIELPSGKYIASARFVEGEKVYVAEKEFVIPDENSLLLSLHEGEHYKINAQLVDKERKPLKSYRLLLRTDGYLIDPKSGYRETSADGMATYEVMGDIPRKSIFDVIPKGYSSKELCEVPHEYWTNGNILQIEYDAPKFNGKLKIIVDVKGEKLSFQDALKSLLGEIPEWHDAYIIGKGSKKYEHPIFENNIHFEGMKDGIYILENIYISTRDRRNLSLVPKDSGEIEIKNGLLLNADKTMVLVDEKSVKTWKAGSQN